MIKVRERTLIFNERAASKQGTTLSLLNDTQEWVAGTELNLWTRLSTDRASGVGSPHSTCVTTSVIHNFK